MKEPQCCFCFVVVIVGSEKNIDLRVPSFRYVSIAHIYMGQYWSQILSVLVTVNDVPNERLHIDEQHLKGNREIAVSTRNKWKALIHRFFVHVTQKQTHTLTLVAVFLRFKLKPMFSQSGDSLQKSICVCISWNQCDNCILCVYLRAMCTLVFVVRTVCVGCIDDCMCDWIVYIKGIFIIIIIFTYSSYSITVYC